MKRVFVQFGVNACGLKEAMSENVSHLFKSDSAPNHSRCRCVPESMCAQPADRNSSKFEMSLRDATNSTATGNRTERCSCAKENERLRALGATVLHVFSKGLANVTWQGQLSFSCRFRRMDSDLTFSPINIREPKTGNFSSPQREPQEQEQDSAIAFANWRLLVTSFQRSIHFLRGQVLGQGCQLPLPNRRDCSDDSRRKPMVRHEEP
jgi:hypothetical protein